MHLNPTLEPRLECYGADYAAQQVAELEAEQRRRRDESTEPGWKATRSRSGQDR
jgi:hypothetical protein